MNNTLLISQKTLSEVSELNDNIDAKLILPTIKEVQELKISPLIGPALFLKLQTDIAANIIGGYYKTLLDVYLRPVLVNYILEELTYKMKFRFTNVGVVERKADYSDNHTERDLKIASERYKSKAVEYSRKVTEYLNANAQHFPEYSAWCGCSSEGAKPGQYDTGIYL